MLCHDGTCLTEGFELLRGQQVDEVRSNTIDMCGSTLDKQVVPSSGEDCILSSPVFTAGVSLHEAGLLHPVDLVCETAPARQSTVRKLTHPQCTVGCLGQAHQDLVISQRDPVIILKFARKLLM